METPPDHTSQDGRWGVSPACVAPAKDGSDAPYRDVQRLVICTTDYSVT
jgi:hypothetical protein